MFSDVGLLISVRWFCGCSVVMICLRCWLVWVRLVMWLILVILICFSFLVSGLLWLIIWCVLRLWI